MTDHELDIPESLRRTPTRNGAGELTVFKPEKTKQKDTILSAAIKAAQELREWQAMHQAIAEKIKEQTKFVHWWGTHVQRPGGDRQSKHSPRPAEMLSLAEAESKTEISNQRVSKWRQRIATGQKYHDALAGPAYRKFMAEEHNHRAQGSGENEWYTPLKYLDMARQVLGEIDLDPASSDNAQKNVQAEKRERGQSPA